MERHERLQWARKRHFETMSAAAEAFEIPNATYTAHENGGRVFDYDAAEFYARRLNVPVEWLVFEIGKRPGPVSDQQVFPLHLWGRLRPDVQKSIINIIEEYVRVQAPDKEAVKNLGTDDNLPRE